MCQLDANYSANIRGVAGTVSLVLSGNDDYPDIRQAREYRNMQFLITTGPGESSSLPAAAPHLICCFLHTAAR